MTGAECELVVETLGAAGDGVAIVDGARVFVPGALPGERWRVRRSPGTERALPIACLSEVPRAQPICSHFERCGGCRLQHFPAAAYAAFKRQRIIEALARTRLPAASVTEPHIGPAHSRRRLRLAVTRQADRLRLGLRERGGQAIVALDVCPVAVPELELLLQSLPAALQGWLGARWPDEISLTLTEAGPDILLHAGRKAADRERQAAPMLAAREGLARVAWQDGRSAPESLVTLENPTVSLAGVTVEVPPGAFLQATRFGEDQLAGSIQEWSQGSRQAADLYAGIGTLSFALSRQVRRVLAVEADPAAVMALRRAASGQNVEAIQRDLTRRPLQPDELPHDLVVLDPPRAGAAAQCAALARSKVGRVIYASCQPESFARDARLLADGGYDLVEVRPIDQFLFSAEVELVALLVRAAPHRRSTRLTEPEAATKRP